MSFWRKNQLLLLVLSMHCREECGPAFAGSCPAVCEKWLIPCWKWCGVKAQPSCLVVPCHRANLQAARVSSVLLWHVWGGSRCSWPTCPPSLELYRVPAQGRSYTVMVSWGHGDLRWASPQPGYGHPFHHSITVTSILKNISHLQFWETNLTHLLFFFFPLFFHSDCTECLHFQGSLLFSVKLLAGHLWY